MQKAYLIPLEATNFIIEKAVRHLKQDHNGNLVHVDGELDIDPS